MPQAFFFNVPGHGHVNPSLPLVAELTRRGHHITYVITEGYRHRVEAAGAQFRAYTRIQDDYFDARGLSGLVPSRVACALITTAGEILPELLDMARAEQPDYILFDGMCPWGRLVARIQKRPAVASLALAPPTRPPLRALLRVIPLFLPLIFRDFRQGILANTRAQALARQYGLPGFGLIDIMNNLGDVSLSYTSSFFQPYANTAPDTVRYVGWTLNETTGEPDFSFEQVKGRRLIYVSLGTLNNDDVTFFRTCIEALAGIDAFVIMSTSSRIAPESFGTLPDHITIHRWVPQVDVLRRATLFISHGGMNSIHDSLYLGVPLVLVPQQAEQTINAMRVVELGAGLMLKPEQVSADTLRATVTRVLAEPGFRVEAARIGDTLRAAGGAARAADQVEALIEKQ